jgi:hypothetical protein
LETKSLSHFRSMTKQYKTYTLCVKFVGDKNLKVIFVVPRNIPARGVEAGESRGFMDP